MAYNEARKRATIKYIKAAYDRIEIKVPKGQKSALTAAAKAKGHDSLNAYTKWLYEQDSGIRMSTEKEK